jgi:NDP-sugar pyrophosphorylase family protein
LDPDNLLRNFTEKPRRQYTVSMGIYMAKKSILEFIPEGKAYGFDHLMLDLLAKRQEVLVVPHVGYWLDIGRPDDYMQAIEEFGKFRTTFIPDND